MQEAVVIPKDQLEDSVVVYHLKQPERQEQPPMELKIEEVEPTEEEVQLMAAKQLLMELKMIKKRIYDSNTLVNSMLIVQIKQLLRGLIKKYNDVGVLMGENVTLRLSNRTKYANIDFVYSPGLQLLMRQVADSLPKPGVEPIQPTTEVTQ